MSLAQIKDKYLGKMVIANKTSDAWHPDGERKLDVGESVKIVIVSNDGQWLGFFCPSKACRSLGN